MTSPASPRPPSPVIPPEDLANLTQADAHKRLMHAAPHAFRGYLLLTADFLTDRRRSCDAALILADRLREVAADTAQRQHVTLASSLVISVVTLADILTDAAPYLPGGAHATARP